jgi:hypothetical protein
MLWNCQVNRRITLGICLLQLASAIPDHFADVGKMVTIGSGATRETTPQPSHFPTFPPSHKNPSGQLGDLALPF